MLILIFVTIILVIEILKLWMVGEIFRRIELIDYTTIIDNLVSENCEMRTQLQEILYKEVN